MRMGSFQRAEEWECLEMMPKTPKSQQTSIGSTSSPSGQKHRYGIQSVRFYHVLVSYREGGNGWLGWPLI